MARRRQPEPPAEVSGRLPQDLAAGPCIEVWADRGGTPSSPAWMRARRAWRRAMDSWAVETGWATDRRPASNAQNLARTRHPWSKTFLLGQGEADLVAFYEGRRAERPERSGRPWDSQYSGE